MVGEPFGQPDAAGLSIQQLQALGVISMAT